MWFLIGKWTILGAERSRGWLRPGWLAKLAKTVGTKRSYLQRSVPIQPKTSGILPGAPSPDVFEKWLEDFSQQAQQYVLRCIDADFAQVSVIFVLERGRLERIRPEILF